MFPPDLCEHVHGHWHELPCHDVECPPHCPADVNDDGVVDVTDILIVVAERGPCV